MVRRTKADAEITRMSIINAARTVFHQCGVGRSSLEKVASVAGVTRGAVYHHFENKAELFFAMRQDVISSMLSPVDEALFSSSFHDPLDAIEAGLASLFEVFKTSAVVRETFEIMITRCEYVDEFAGVQDEVARPSWEFLAKIECVYEQASRRGTLRTGLSPHDAARDTWAFVDGLLHLIVRQPGQLRREQIAAMIQTHMLLRRA